MVLQPAKPKRQASTNARDRRVGLWSEFMMVVF